MRTMVGTFSAHGVIYKNSGPKMCLTPFKFATSIIVNMAILLQVN